MPGQPRGETVDPSVVAVYHTWVRCVRQCWLCGYDSQSGVDYEYRRNWIVERQQLLAQLYAIEIGFHAELSDHLHLILRNRPDVVETWTDEEVVRRILIINKLVHNFSNVFDEPNVDEIRLQICRADEEKMAWYRQRLADISYFMGSLNEHISRRANSEDGVTGAFWDRRFSHRNLEDEASILVCGMYVDLNQIRAGEASTPEQSKHTSAHDRIRSLQELTLVGKEEPKFESIPAAAWLCELTLQEGPDADIPSGLEGQSKWRLTDKGLLPITLTDYLELLDWTGRQQVKGKSGSIPKNLANILVRLRIAPEAWLESVKNFDSLFGRIVGQAQRVAERVNQIGRRWVKGQKHCETAFANESTNDLTS